MILLVKFIFLFLFSYVVSILFIMLPIWCMKMNIYNGHPTIILSDVYLANYFTEIVQFIKLCKDDISPTETAKIITI